VGDVEACSLGRVESILKYHPHGNSRISKLENLRFLFDVGVKRNWMTVLVYETSVSKGTCGFESHPLYKIKFPNIIIKVNTDEEKDILIAESA